MNDIDGLDISPATLLTATEAAGYVASRSSEEEISTGKGLGLLLILGVVLYYLVKK